MMQSTLWTAAWLTPLEQGLNGYLKLDPAWPDWLKPLHRKTLAIVLRPMKLRVLCHMGPTGIRLSSDESLVADAEIEALPSTFLAYVYTKQQNALLNDGRLQLSGDLQVIQAFEDLMNQVKPDWEALLAEKLGDVWAYRIGQGIKRSCETISKNRKLTGQQLSEYLQDELKLLPAKALLIDFYAQVDEVREQSDRLEAKLAYYRQLISNKDK